MAILELQENGRIQMLYNKWWKGADTCVRDENKESKASALGVENVGGIFVVLLVGLALAVFVAICEFVWKSKRDAREDKVKVLSIRLLLSYIILCNILAPNMFIRINFNIFVSFRRFFQVTLIRTSLFCCHENRFCSLVLSSYFGDTRIYTSSYLDV